MMSTPACYLFRWPFGRLEIAESPNWHWQQFLAPAFRSWGPAELPVQERLSGAIDVVLSEALRDRLPAQAVILRAGPD
jgi:hypothetical protein